MIQPCTKLGFIYFILSHTRSAHDMTCHVAFAFAFAFDNINIIMIIIIIIINKATWAKLYYIYISNQCRLYLFYLQAK